VSEYLEVPDMDLQMNKDLQMDKDLEACLLGERAVVFRKANVDWLINRLNRFDHSTDRKIHSPRTRADRLYQLLVLPCTNAKSKRPAHELENLAAMIRHLTASHNFANRNKLTRRRRSS
jgi:hypothetical protein